MTKIAMRRTRSSRAPTSARPVSNAARRCSTSGTTRSFDTMMASATDSTITMAVAADNPPTKGRHGEERRIGVKRQRQHEHVAVHLPGREGQHAGERDRHHEQVDQHEIEREQPGRALDLGFVVVLDHRDVKLPWQQHDGDERQQRHRQHGAESVAAGQRGGGVGPR